MGAFERFYRAKGPFQNLASAQKHVALFMLGYVFETFSAEASTARRRPAVPAAPAAAPAAIETLNLAVCPAVNPYICGLATYSSCDKE